MPMEPGTATMAETGRVIEVPSLAVLSELVGTPSPRTAAKEHSRLLPEDKDWLAACRFCLIATSAVDGTCDVSPKGDRAGFVMVLDGATIAIPDRPGNKRTDGLRNILSGNPHVGLLFMIPGRGDTLRINGRARVLRDAPFFDQMIARGRRPQFAILIEVDEIFMHCSSAFKRSELWQPQTWQPDTSPSNARIFRDNFAEICGEITGDPEVVAQACDNRHFARFICSATTAPEGSAWASLCEQNAVELIKLFGGDSNLRTCGAVRQAIAAIIVHYWREFAASTAAPADPCTFTQLDEGRPPRALRGITGKEWRDFLVESMRDKDAAAALLAYASQLSHRRSSGARRASPAAVDKLMADSYQAAGAPAGSTPDAIASHLPDAALLAEIILGPEDLGSSTIIDADFGQALAGSRELEIRHIVAGNLESAIGLLR